MKLKLPGLVTFIGGLLVAAVAIIAGVISGIQIVMALISYLGGGSPTVAGAMGYVEFLAAAILLVGEGILFLPHGIKGLVASLGAAEEDKLVKHSMGFFMVLAELSIATVVLYLIFGLISGGFYLDVKTLIFGVIALVLIIAGRMLAKSASTKLVGVILMMIVPAVHLVQLFVVGVNFANVWDILNLVATAAMVGGTVWLLVYVLLNTLKGSKAE